jgi:hypothetical protein
VPAAFPREFARSQNAFVQDGHSTFNSTHSLQLRQARRVAFAMDATCRLPP